MRLSFISGLIVFSPLASLLGTKQSHEIRIYAKPVLFLKSIAKTYFIILSIIFLFPFNGFSQAGNEKIEANHITIKGNDIYFDNDMIGNYRNIFIDSELTSIVIYNKTKARVAEATYAKGDANWTIITPVDQEKMYLQWSKEHTLELLFAFLVEKKYL